MNLERHLGDGNFLSKHQVKNSVHIGRKMTLENGGKTLQRYTSEIPYHFFRDVQVGSGTG